MEIEKSNNEILCPEKLEKLNEKELKILSDEKNDIESKKNSYLISKFRKTSNDSLETLSTKAFAIEEEELTPIKTFTPKIIIWSENIITKKMTRKVTINRADCIRKRIKTHYNQFLLKYINKEISTYFPNLCFMKLSQNFISDVKIESNKFFLNLKLKEIFSKEFIGSRNFSHNKEVLNTIEKSENQVLIVLLNKTYSSFYSDYLISDFYEKNLAKLKGKEGEYYMTLFKSHSLDLIDYYKKGTPYRRKSNLQQEFDLCSQYSGSIDNSFS